jgi:hypothetical protein
VLTDIYERWKNIQGRNLKGRRYRNRRKGVEQKERGKNNEQNGRKCKFRRARSRK